MDDHWEEEFRKAAEEAEKAEERSEWKRLRFVLGIILAVLMVSYFLVDPTVREVITGFFESSKAEQDRFYHGGNVIVFEGKTFDDLRWWFRTNQENEVRLCLEGRIEGTQYLVEEITAPEVHFQSVYKVISAPCPKGTVIDLHTHPYQKCVASQTDLAHLENMKRINENVLLGVMCTEDRISFYG